MFQNIYTHFVLQRISDDIISTIFQYLTCNDIGCDKYGSKKLVKNDLEYVYDRKEFNTDCVYCPIHYLQILNKIEEEKEYFKYCYNEYEDYSSDGIYEKW